MRTRWMKLRHLKSERGLKQEVLGKVEVVEKALLLLLLGVRNGQVETTLIVKA